MGQTVTLQIPFGGGLNEKLSPHYQDPNAQLASVTNGNYVKANVVDKRLGIGLTGQLPASTFPNPVARLAAWSKGDVNVLSQNGLYAVEAATGSMVNVGPLPPAQTVRRPIPLSANAVNLLPVIGDLPTATTTLRIVVYTGAPIALTGGNAVYALVYDINTQQIVKPPTLLYTSTAGAPGLVLVANVLYLPNAPANEQLAIFFADTTQSGNANLGLFACNYVAATNSFTTPVNLAQGWTGGTQNPIWDVAPFVGDSSGRYLFTYAPSTGGYVVYVVSPAHVLGANVSVALPGGYASGGARVPYSSNQVYVCGQSGTSDLIWLVYTGISASTTMQLFIASWGQPNSFPVNLAPTSIATQPYIWAIPPVQTSQTQVLFGYETVAANALTNTFAGSLYTASSAGSTFYGYVPLGYFPIARPFVLDSTVFLPSVLNLGLGSEQMGQYLLQVQGSAGTACALPVGTSAPRQVDQQSIVNGMAWNLGSAVLAGPNHVPFGAVANPTAYTAVPIRVAGEDTQSATLAPLTNGNPGLSLSTWQTTYNFSSPLQYEASELGGLLHIQGGTPFLYDGGNTYEDNFFFYPEFTAMATTGTGTTLTTGAYTYALVYVYADSAGLVHRSAPYFTNPIAVTNGGAYPQLSIPELASWRIAAGATVYCEIYRTTASPVSPVFYLLDRIVINGNLGGTFAVYNDNNGNNGNTALQTSTILYTTGNVLDRVNAPASNGQVIYKSRKWQVDDTLQSIWFTQQFTPGEAPGFNDGALVITFSDGGDITGLATLDTELIVFKKNSIWLIFGGDGPNSEGTGPDETTPVQVAIVGATDWRSIVRTDVGVMFAHSSGIYLFDRSLGTTFIGTKVQDLFAQYPICVGAALVPGTTQVRFAMLQNVGIAPETTVIVYDYLLQQWTQHVYAQQSANLASLALSSSGVYTMNTTDGRIWQENANLVTPAAGQYMDENASAVASFVPTSITTAEIKVMGSGALQAYQRARWVQLYADALDPCQVTMELAFNGVPAIVQSRTWAWSQLDDLPYVQVSQHVGALYTKAMSVQITVSDSADPASVTGQGVRWSGLAIELDALKDRYRQVPVQNR